MIQEKCFKIVIQMVWLGAQIVTGCAEGATGRIDVPGATEVVFDFLSSSTEEFEERYDRNELYDRNILYCDRRAWKYDGEAVDGFQEPEDYFFLDDITAIRFVNIHSPESDLYEAAVHFDDNQTDGNVVLQYFGDYAVSMYFQEERNTQNGSDELKLKEISYIKVKLSQRDSRETVPETLYEFLEKGYYEVQEELRAGEWAFSPEQKKAVYISNGALPKHPSQIFVRFQENAPDLVFRNTWQYLFMEWIDEDHFICYNDASPILVHLETEWIEVIKKESDDFDAWGCHYVVKEHQLIAMFSDEEYYRWDITQKDGEISITKAESPG